MHAASRRGRRSTNFWPAFVDALSTLVMVVIFVLLVFMVAQYFLTSALSNREDALSRLTQQVNELSDLLALERSEKEELRASVAQLSAELQGATSARDDLAGQLAALLDSKAELESALAGAQQQVVTGEQALADEKQQRTAAEEDLAKTQQQLAETQQALDEAQAQASELQQALASAQQTIAGNEQELMDAYKTIDADKATIEAQLAELALLKSLRDQLSAEVAKLTDTLQRKDAEVAGLQQDLADTQQALDQSRAETGQSQQALDEQTQMTEEAQRQAELLNAQLLALRNQLADLMAALDAAEQKNQEQEVQIANLGQRLNEALATKVQELARYRSEFFGRMREVLGSRQDIRIVGDRFVFQSEVLFKSGEATLGPEGEAQLAALATTLKEIIPQIPEGIDWVLQVNGHTDKRPVVNSPYASNWELSQARALSVVRFLVSQGIPPNRLAAAGFAEFQPLDPGDSEEAYRANRRIEIKLTER